DAGSAAAEDADAEDAGSAAAGGRSNEGYCEKCDERSGELAHPHLEQTVSASASMHADVIITSYPLLRRDTEHYTCRKYHTLILDEAQAIKNPTTAIAKVARGLEAEYRFGLTGTPIENRLEDLWSIYRVVFPGLFPDRKAFSDLTRETVARRIRPFLLRRLKSEVLKELPEKIETMQTSELLPEQRRLYAAYLAKLRHETLKHLDSDDFGRERIRILAGITRLRQICCHPALFAEDYTGSSAKFEQLLELIEECAGSGKRPLIFSQFTSMLEMIGRELGYRGISYFYLDGSTPAAERVELCNRFNAGERDLFLLSLKAGGTGLNLTGADTVILYDLWWNPAVEQQAADRAHRIGQRSVVQVIRLVARGTVEDKMYQLQERKRSLIDEVIQPGQESFSSLTEQDIREILSLEE
ncbi:DEAD/DEAH box helicase, partial [Paenibacillus sp. J5C_2022]|uniref:DEAD/DEAH box helicase n=1 Tax=Paenibacillus sp. J5C2022 TaxID=2977129 RepID=UPI0021D3364F